MTDLIVIMGYIGVFVFALTGALAGARKGMDIFGIALAGTVTGIGGGTVRDVLLGHTPVFWVQEPEQIMVCLAASLMVFLLARVKDLWRGYLRWLDAMGLAIFCVGGADIALQTTDSWLVAVIMGGFTAIFGGIIRDLLCDEIPYVLRQEIYATAAFLGAGVYVTGLQLQFGAQESALVAMAAAFTLRALALILNLEAPKPKL